MINRVFDSSGPEGKVRGTPQQIIEKYQMLARDAQLSGDRVAAENFLQHAEHFARLLNDAQREQNQRRELQEARQNQRRDSQPNAPQQPAKTEPETDEQPDVGDAALSVHGVQESGLVETPEGKNKKNSDEQSETGQAAE